MLVPGISGVFDIYYCKSKSDRCYYDDKETYYEGDIKILSW